MVYSIHFGVVLFQVARSKYAEYSPLASMRSGFVKRVSRATEKQDCLYSVVNHTIYTQEYFAIRRRCSPRRVCETQISKNTQEYRSGHNEAVLKTSFVCLCNFLKTLDFIGFFAGSSALCEKRFAQFSRKFPTEYFYGGLSKRSQRKRAKTIINRF